MYQLLQAILNGDEKAALEQLILSLTTADKRYFLRNEILQAFANYCHQSQKPTYFYHCSSVGKLIHYTHEMILREGRIKFLSQQPPDEPYVKFRSHLQELGLEAGWGDTTSRVCETLELLERLGAESNRAAIPINGSIFSEASMSYPLCSKLFR